MLASPGKAMLASRLAGDLQVDSPIESPGSRRRVAGEFSEGLGLRSWISGSGFGFLVQGLGFRVSGLGFGFWVSGLGFLVQDLGFRVSGLGFGFRVSGLGFGIRV